MSGIRGKNTKPELFVRGALHRQGFRFRLHDKNLPGKPDLVLKKYNAAILVNGCFWHGHDCDLFKWPKSRGSFWRKKISDNVARDKANLKALSGSGIRTCIIWECSIKGKGRRDPERLIAELCGWLTSNTGHIEFCGCVND